MHGSVVGGWVGLGEGSPRNTGLTGVEEGDDLGIYRLGLEGIRGKPPWKCRYW